MGSDTVLKQRERVAPNGTLAERSATCLPLAEREHVRVMRRQDPRQNPRNGHRSPLTLSLSLCMDRGDGRHLFGDMVDGVILPIGLM